MDTVTLEKVFKKIENKFRKNYHRKLIGGVFACNQLDSLQFTNDSDIALIVNTDPSTKPGTHWQALWIPKTSNNNHYRSCHFFDSYGTPPSNEYILKFIRKSSQVTVWSDKQMQDFDSFVCGEYCCVFLSYMTRGLSYSSFYKQFDEDLSHFDKNDKKTIKLFKSIFGRKNLPKGVLIQTCKSLKDCTEREKNSVNIEVN